jgi:ribonuclease P protein component
VYDHGTRYSGRFFAAFYLRGEQPDGKSVSRIGFTVPRSLGGAVVRNRIKRRVREAVRLRLEQLNPQWEIVFNPRRAAMDSPFSELVREVEQFFLRCNNSL